MQPIHHPVSGTLTALHLECIKQSVLDTFNAISGEELLFLGINNNGHNYKTEGMIGIISIVGDILWSITLGLPKNTVLSLGPKFAGFDIHYYSDDMGDMVGELTNIVAGDILARLDAIGVSANMSLPTVARGSDLELFSLVRPPSMRMAFSTENIELWLKVAVGHAIGTGKAHILSPNGFGNEASRK
jgi:chemotaxis protein CheX